MSIPTPWAHYNMNNNTLDTQGHMNLNHSWTSFSRFSHCGGGSIYCPGPDHGNEGSTLYTFVNPWMSISTNITVVYWCYPINFGWASAGLMFGGMSGNSQEMRKLGLDNSGQVSFSIPGYCTFACNGINATLNEWQMIAVVYKGNYNTTTPYNTCHGFRNKTKSTSTTFTGSTTSSFSYSFCIGLCYTSWNLGYNYNAFYLDETFIFTSQLTDQQIRDIYDFTAPKYGIQGYA